jgi:ABC-type Fe3+/spermidine/putrescine transport system ATPase subunit
VAAILFDEPLTVIDPHMKWMLRRQLKKIHQQLKLTLIYVTHDQVEALAMSDRIALMRDGVIVQEGTPRDIYLTPKSTFTADFVGSANIIDGRVTTLGPTGIGCVDSEIGTISALMPDRATVGARVQIVIRPEAFRLLLEEPPNSSDPQNIFRTTIEQAFFVGASVEALVQVGPRRLRVKLDPYSGAEQGEAVTLEVLADRCFVILGS